MVKELLTYQEEDALLRAIEQDLQGSEERKKTAQARKFLEGVDENLAALEKKAKDLAGLYESIAAAHKDLGETLKEIAGATESCEDENAKAAQAQYKEYKAKYDELKGGKEAERKAIEGRLAEIEKTVDAALMAKYKAKRKDKMFPVLFEAKGNMCGKCLMEISMADINKLKGGSCRTR